MNAKHNIGYCKPHPKASISLFPDHGCTDNNKHNNDIEAILQYAKEKKKLINE